MWYDGLCLCCILYLSETWFYLEYKQLLIQRVGLRAARGGLAAPHLHAQRADEAQLHVRVRRLVGRQLAEVGAFDYLQFC